MCRYNKLNSRKSWETHNCDDPKCEPIVMRSQSGYFIGTITKEGFPNCRISNHFENFHEAKEFLDKYSGEKEESEDNEHNIPEVSDEDNIGKEKEGKQDSQDIDEESTEV